MREKPRSFFYAVLVHALLLAVLVFSLDWESTLKPAAERKNAPVQAVVVDAAKLESEIRRQKQLQENKRLEEEDRLRRLEKQAREAEEKRRREEERLAELKRQQEQDRRKAAEAKKLAEAKKKAEAEKKRKAELAAKKKAEEEKKRKAEAERKRIEEEKRKAEAERKEEEKRKAEAERKRKEEEARRKAAEQELQARLAAEQERLAAQRQSAMQRMIYEYVGYIQEKVQRSWIRPPGSSSELSCTVEVKLIPSGDVVDAQIVRSSGNPAFDRSVEAAVFKAQPLPVPPDREVMEKFRLLRFEFKPG